MNQEGRDRKRIKMGERVIIRTGERGGRDKEKRRMGKGEREKKRRRKTGEGRQSEKLNDVGKERKRI